MNSSDGKTTKAKRSKGHLAKSGHFTTGRLAESTTGTKP
jgi:hypothetical protein